jgi:hypothetical protein
LHIKNNSEKSLKNNAAPITATIMVTTSRGMKSGACSSSEKNEKACETLVGKIEHIDISCLRTVQVKSIACRA